MDGHEPVEIPCGKVMFVLAVVEYVEYRQLTLLEAVVAHGGP